jgi:8-amino-7-oxononanoate synthase
MQPQLRQVLQQARQQRQQQQQWRQLRCNDEQLVDFCSNDYLGLRRHPQVLQAYCDGLHNHGAGSGASPLVSGYQSPHRYLSERLAEWLAREAVVLFTSGFAANHSLLCTLGPHYQQLLLDRLAHASLLDGAQASGCRWRRFPHNAVAAAGHYAARVPQSLLVTESVFSMDGDQATVAQLLTACPAADVLIDDAHGIGVLGDEGRSCGGQFSASEVDYLTITFGKAFGVGGAAIACSTEIAEYLHNFSRELVYSTAFAAAQAQAINAALTIIQSSSGQALRLALQHNIQHFHAWCLRYGLPVQLQPAAIQTLLLGAEGRALQVSELLRQQGIDCRAIRPPTVAAGQSRLRIVLSARHQPAQIEQLVTALASILEQLGHD